MLHDKVLLKIKMAYNTMMYCHALLSWVSGATYVSYLCEEEKPIRKIFKLAKMQQTIKD